MNVSFDLVEINKDNLPEISECLVSKTLMFIVDGKPNIGHYHCNGWFYAHGTQGVMGLIHAAGPKARYDGSKAVGTGLKVTHWQYFDKLEIKE